MHASTTLLLHSVPSSLIPNTDPKAIELGIGNLFFRQQRIINTKRQSKNKLSACRDSQELAVTDFNLYELLGIDSSSDTRAIKEAYRALQKRCHPDIAGPPGHDMAIVLNEAYALLSDPISRMAYDREVAKVADLQGYTGRPIYSIWSGPESEERAVFVDEVKCVGCLKCALFAQKTFAVESVYGRARVVAQWADPEHKINDAIAACPVDCISFVERSELPALEFVMSKQPRGSVRIGASNTAGVRTADVFDEVHKFQARYKASKRHSKDSEPQNSSRISAVQAIQMISNWLYWRSPTGDAAPLAIRNSRLGTGKHDAQPSLEKLKAAAAVRKQQATTTARTSDDDYWVPAALALPQLITPESRDDRAPSRKKKRASDADKSLNRKKDSSIPFGWVVPIGASVVAAAVVADRLRLGEPATGLQEHIGGSVALAIVNSWWMQVGLAGVTWYLIAVYMLEIVEALRRK